MHAPITTPRHRGAWLRSGAMRALANPQARAPCDGDEGMSHAIADRTEPNA